MPTDKATDWPFVESDMNAWREWAKPRESEMKFMDWWHSVNVVLKGRNQEPMLYGEARDYFKELGYR